MAKGAVKRPKGARATLTWQRKAGQFLAKQNTARGIAFDQAEYGRAIILRQMAIEPTPRNASTSTGDDVMKPTKPS